jgi:hypothetical protein
MADIIVDGMTRVAFVPTIANVAAPTAAELTAGTYLGTVLTAGGMEGFEASTGEVDNTSYDSRFDTRLPGVSAYSGTRLILKKQTGTDTVFTTMTTFGTTGYIVIRDALDKDTAFAAAQKVNIYPITTGDWDYMSRERNSVLRYWVATPIRSEPEKNATVAA